MTEVADRRGVASGGGAATLAEPEPPRRRLGDLGPALVFLAPALVVLGALVLYPIVATVVRSLYDRSGEVFVGLDNYERMLTSERTLTAIRNNAIWVVVAPTVVTVLGLIFAVLTERVRWSTAFKVAVFMPMAISFLAAGVIFRLVYEADPDRGVANAVLTSVVDVFRDPGPVAGARPRDEAPLSPENGALLTNTLFSPGQAARLPLVGLRPGLVPENAHPARLPAAQGESAIVGSVWLDFAPGGDGVPGAIDRGERGLPGVRVEAVDERGQAVAATSTEPDGSFRLDVGAGRYRLRLPPSNFQEKWAGIAWLGPTLVTPAIIGSYVWIWAGFAMVLIAAGLSAIPREALEAARVDGGSEWQVFRRVTVPLLRPVLVVVLVTLIINVLKVFDLVLIIPPGSVQDDATVLALEMWRVSFGGGQDQGLGSALGVFLFLLVVPAMVFNVRRFRQEG